MNIKPFISRNIYTLKPLDTRRVSGSLLLADITGFTELSGKFRILGKSGTEKLADMLNLFFGSIIEIIKEYGGIVLKFGGDAILVGFYGDKKESKNIAGNCALKLLERIKEIGLIKTDIGDFRILLKIVIETGEWKETIIGNERRSTLFLSGDTIKRLAITEDNALSSKIYIDGSIKDEKDIGISKKVTYIKGDKEIDDREYIKYLPEGVCELIESGLSGEHRATSIVFINFYGYDEEEPEINKIQEFFIRVIQITERYKGSINKIDISSKGSKILITYGSPVSHEKDVIN